MQRGEESNESLGDWGGGGGRVALIPLGRPVPTEDSLHRENQASFQTVTPTYSKFPFQDNLAVHPDSTSGGFFLESPRDDFSSVKRAHGPAHEAGGG